MIKLGCNAMQKVKGSPSESVDVESLIELIRELKLDIVDFQLDRGFRSRDPDYLRRIKLRCHRYGLPIGFIGAGAGFVGHCRGPGGEVLGAPLPPRELRQRIAQVREAVEVAAFMGAPLVRLFGSGIPARSENRLALWSSVIASFQEVCDYAAERGILVGLHNHAPAVPPTGDDILSILRDVDRSNFTFIMDTGQWWGSPGSSGHDPEVDFYQFMEQTAAHATYVRAKIYKIDSGREEWLDYRRIMAILKAANFNGNMSIVFEDRGNRCDYPRSIALGAAHLRAVLAEFSM